MNEVFLKGCYVLNISIDYYVDKLFIVVVDIGHQIEDVHCHKKIKNV